MNLKNDFSQMPFDIDPSSIVLDADVESKEALFALAGHKAAEQGITHDAIKLSADFAKRESEMTTGLMDGFAIPHAKSEAVEHPAVFYIRTKDPLPWKMLSGNSARHFFFLMVSPRDEGSTFVGMLSKLASCLMDKEFRKRVASSEDGSELAEYLIKCTQTA